MIGLPEKIRSHKIEFNIAHDLYGIASKSKS